MSRRLYTFVPTATLVLMLASPAWAAWNAPVPPDKLPNWVIPKMTTPPTIDGRMAEGEWTRSVAVSGVGGCTDAILIARPTTYYLAWDSGHLFMAIRTWVKPGYKPRVSGRLPGSAGVFDDSAELHFQPLGKNVAPGRTDSSYKFILNSLGMMGDLQRVAVGQQFKNWNPKFQVAAGMTEPGSAPNGGRWLVIEYAATTQDFELTGDNRPGDTWKFMLGFNHMYSGWMQARIPAITSYFDPGGYPVGTLADDAPAVQMTMDQMPGLCDGVAAVKVAAFNPKAQAAKLDVLIEYRDKDGNELLTRKDSLTVEPGKSADYVLNEKLPELTDKLPGTMVLRVSEGPRELLRYFTRFDTKYPKDALLPAEKPEGAFPLRGTLNPVRSNFLLVADAYYLDDPPAARSVEYRVLRDADKQVATQGVIDKPVTDYFRRLIQLPPLEAGRYTVEAVMNLADGTKLGPVRTSFQKLDEAVAFKDWWNTKLGDSERVITPFTPMIREGSAVSCWGRVYDLTGLGLPKHVVSQGKSVSAAPARLVAVIGGKEHVIPMGEPKFIETKDWRVRFTGEAEGAGLKFTASGWVEQDGMAQVELTYAPAGEKPVKVDALRLEFPVAADEAPCLLCLGQGGNYSSRTTMLVPDKQGEIWSTLVTGLNGAGMAEGSFYPVVWLGGDERGFLWTADNDKGWVPDNAVPAHQVIRQGDVLVLRNNIIGKPFELAGPRTITYGYMASPFRPLVKGWRAALSSLDGTFTGINKGRTDPKTGKEFDGWNLLTPPSADPNEWDALWAGYKVLSDQRMRQLQWTNPWLSRNTYGSTVHTSLPLMGYGWKSPDERVTGYFANDWEGDSWSKTEQDYFLWIADQAFAKGGLKTIYWDIFFLATKPSVQAGLAYELPDGRIQPGYNAQNIRRFMMRMYALMSDHGLTPGSQVSHATNCYCLPACGWMDAILDGEYHAISDDSGMDWVDGYPIDRMRALSVTQNWGVQISWMKLISIKDTPKREHALRGFREYPRLYDSWRGDGANIPPDVLEWGLNDSRVEFHPFWRNPYVQPADANILVSAWTLSDRVILVVFNNDRAKTRDAVVKVDLDALGLVPKLKWQEFVRCRDLDKAEGEPACKLDFYGRTLSVPKLLPHTSRVIGIRRY